MAIFVHLFDAKDKKSIIRSGIKLTKTKNYRIRGVYATPQLSNYELTHQWMRELRRFNQRITLAARFRIPDKEQVYIGRFNQKHLLVSASKAIAIASNHHDGLGLEVIISRTIHPQEIIKIYQPPKITGWRYYPEAHDRKPCGCDYCQRGQPYSRKLQTRYEQDLSH
ncbi:MAG: hypothetical protein AAF298_20630 [Cyanobacteria bacterium P01_A01_bin.40]